jgi:hypothetical protein
MLGDIELAAADRGMGDFQHGICPRYVYGAYCTVPRATVNCGLRIADCGLARGVADGRFIPPRCGGLVSRPLAIPESRILQAASHEPLIPNAGSRIPISGRRPPSAVLAVPPPPHLGPDPFRRSSLVFAFQSAIRTPQSAMLFPVPRHS